MKAHLILLLNKARKEDHARRNYSKVLKWFTDEGWKEYLGRFYYEI